MSNGERALVVAMLYSWSEWCHKNPDSNWFEWYLCGGGPAWRAAWDWCEPSVDYWITLPSIPDGHRGHEAALALCFAAAMVEAGDSSRGER